MSNVEALVHEAKALGAKFEISGDRIKVAAPRPLPSILMEKLRERKPDVLEFLQLEFEPWALREWRRVSIPEWREILAKSVDANESRREDYARWMLREVLLDAQYEEQSE